LAALRALIDRIEAVIHRDVGRGMEAIFAASRGGLFSAASALAAERDPRIGLMTGFFVPGADPPAAETDGPVSAALLARAFGDAGVSCRLVTDTLCADAVHVALARAGAADVPVDAVAPGQSPDAVTDNWRRVGISHVVAIERCGPARDGRVCNMRGVDISAHTASLEQVFLAGPWKTIGIGDGGNELGMGRVPWSLLRQNIPHGASVGCIVPADHLITAGVSHWGGYALAAALATLRPAWAAAMQTVLHPELERAVLEAMVRDGPAVDGVTGRREATIDALPLAEHHAVLAQIKACGRNSPQTPDASKH
jgi:D-glutamate cyclase